MKKSDITQPIIDKCKQLAEHWRMEIYVGCWIVTNFGTKLIIKHPTEIPHFRNRGDFTPIPSIWDCLEKLRELGFKAIIHFDYPGDEPMVDAFWFRAIPPLLKSHKKSPSFHEALLSALLEVLTNE